MNLDFSKLGGLIPVIIQDFQTLEVLMLGFMNEEALFMTKETGRVTFYSRSKGRLWQKGETSGNYLEAVEIKADCDSDSLLILARASGPTCHTGEQSCFGEGNFTLQKLFRLIGKRKKEMPENSYTVSLFKDGREKILEKVQEEALEVLKAARSEGRQRLIEESCDLLYHLFVLLASEEIEMKEVEKEMKKRN